MNKLAKIEDICADMDADHEHIIQLCNSIMERLAHLHNLTVQGNQVSAINLIERIEIDVSDIKDLAR